MLGNRGKSLDEFGLHLLLNYVLPLQLDLCKNLPLVVFEVLIASLRMLACAHDVKLDKPSVGLRRKDLSVALYRKVAARSIAKPSCHWHLEFILAVELLQVIMVFG